MMALQLGAQAMSRGSYRMATEMASWVAAQPGDWDPNSGRDPEWGKAAPAGLLIWLFLGVMLFLLIKSMNKHMRRVPASFDTETSADDGSGDGHDTSMTSPASVDDADSAAAAAGAPDTGQT